MSKRRIYADGMENISLADGMIRMSLYSIIPNQPGETAPARHDVDTELVMSPAGFLRAYSAMEQLLQQLTEAGLITKRQPQAADEAKPTTVSPNFQ